MLPAGGGGRSSPQASPLNRTHTIRAAAAGSDASGSGSGSPGRGSPAGSGPRSAFTHRATDSGAGTSAGSSPKLLIATVLGLPPNSDDAPPSSPAMTTAVSEGSSPRDPPYGAGAIVTARRGSLNGGTFVLTGNGRNSPTATRSSGGGGGGGVRLSPASVAPLPQQPLQPSPTAARLAFTTFAPHPQPSSSPSSSPPSPVIDSGSARGSVLVVTDLARSPRERETGSAPGSPSLIHQQQQHHHQHHHHQPLAGSAMMLVDAHAMARHVSHDHDLGTAAMAVPGTVV